MENITFDTLNLATIVPMCIAIVGALIILCIDIVKSSLSKSFYTMLTILVLLMDLGAILLFSSNERGFFDMMLVDGIALLSQIIILVASMLFIPLALSKTDFNEHKFAEYFALFLFMIAGFQFMVATENLILIFLGLETASLALYALIAMHGRTKAVEAALKYFVMGALAAGFYAFGSMIFYALTGSVEISIIVERLGERGYEPIFAVLGATIFILATLAFKLSLIPFHTWTPDVYEGSSAPLAGYMSIVPKIAAFVVAIRFFDLLLSSNLTWLHDMLYVLVVLTMTLSNLMALVQSDVKRMLAFSSISHAGFVLAAVLINSEQGNSAVFVYWILFMFSNLGAFSMLWLARNKQNLWDERYQHPYIKFSGMIQVSPMAATLMGLFMLSLAGLPPFSVFWGKIYILGAAINAGYVILAIIMALNSAVAIYYYLKLVVYIFLKDPISEDGNIYIINSSKPLKVVVGFAALTTLFAIFLVEPILKLVSIYM
ncbi:MAG: NADH-quinone oxidoreductase subunit NuoN [Campylobacteraceae bacterium]